MSYKKEQWTDHCSNVMMTLVAEGNLVKKEVPTVPGRSLSVKEARERLSKLVEGEGERELKEGRAETEEARVEKKEIGEGDELEREVVSEVADAKTPGSPTDDQPVDTSDDEVLTDEEMKKAERAGLNRAIRWLAAWLKRQREKLQL